MTDLVHYELSDFIATITIDRPKALNALSTEVLVELEEKVAKVKQDNARCIVLTGAGKRSFVAGADIEAISTMTQKEALEFSIIGNRVFRDLEKLSIPSIAAVNGFALGGGCELALSCDIRIASENAIFAQPEVGLGITPGFGGSQRLARVVPIGIAKEMLYTTKKIDAHYAKQIGLVNEVYPQDELMDAAYKMANKIAQNAPIAVQGTKAALTEGIHNDLDTAGAIEAIHFSACFTTEDQRSAMSAFNRKEKPGPFVGR